MIINKQAFPISYKLYLECYIQESNWCKTLYALCIYLGTIAVLLVATTAFAIITFQNAEFLSPFCILAIMLALALITIVIGTVDQIRFARWCIQCTRNEIQRYRRGMSERIIPTTGPMVYTC